MGKITEKVHAFNSFVRTIILLVIMGLLGGAGYWGYNKYVLPAMQVDRLTHELETLKADYERQSIQLQRVETALKLMKVDRRIANIKVLETGEVEASGEPFVKVEFVELGQDGKPVCEPRQFTLRGDEIYVNSLVVKFEDKYVEAAEELRGTSLCVFRSIYGDIDGPNGGHALDQTGIGQGSAYGKMGEMTEFEKKIWDDFWDVANDPERRDALGIRAIHGEAPYTRVRPGMTYRLELRSSGGVSLVAEKSKDE
ncbi:MAG TPA: hypothetical protein PKD64_07695 [Pirellulaceae bacterium]|nr:hypothetical protein [Pirellulaceae bacterium]HMO92070.1 hypothetical protein [Pirellulaceae bacterium]HMP69944.1 hypothetical protein [Pirellulaceae bacterium]